MRRHLTFSNVVAALALFVALGGSSYAALKISGASIRDRSIPSRKLKRHSVTGTEVNMRKLGKVGSASRADAAITAQSATAAQSATTAQTAHRADSAGNADTVGGVAPNAFTLARSNDQSDCTPDLNVFGSCGSTSIALPRPARVLALVTGNWNARGNAQEVGIECAVRVDGVSTGRHSFPGTSDGRGVGYDDTHAGALSLSALTAPLPAGNHTVALFCQEKSVTGNTGIDVAPTITAVMLGSG